MFSVDHTSRSNLNFLFYHFFARYSNRVIDRGWYLLTRYLLLFYVDSVVIQANVKPLFPTTAIIVFRYNSALQRKYFRYPANQAPYTYSKRVRNLIEIIQIPHCFRPSCCVSICFLLSVLNERGIKITKDSPWDQPQTGMSACTSLFEF